MPELRWGPISHRWVVIAKERARRPDEFPCDAEPTNDPASCPFCPENVGRASKEILTLPNATHTGWQVRVVANRYPALQVEGDLEPAGVGVYDRMNGIGAHEVVIETPDHQRSLSELSVEEITMVLTAYKLRLEDLRRDLRLRYVMIFKNYRAAAGATLTHGHTQIIATPVIPVVPQTELHSAREHFRHKERCLFCDILDQERSSRERLVRETDAFLTYCPYAAHQPFEMWVMPRRHQHDFSMLNERDLYEFAGTVKDALVRLREALNDPPYNFVLKTAPSPHPRPGRPSDWATIALDYHWHLQIIPRLTRPAGFEWGTGIYINPTPPEVAADYLRRVKPK